jgi:multidrug efflux pump subunit AcrA (membrane-fusion protein)
VGIETSSDVEIVAGLNEGDQVVVSDRSGLRPGEKVTPKEVGVPDYREGDSQQ